MATAFKCDICGSYFSREEKNRQLWKVIPSLDASVRPVRLDDYEPRDICPECYVTLEKLMKPAVLARWRDEDDDSKKKDQ